MNWIFQDFDADLNHLVPEVKAKAIEIASTLVEKEGYSKDRAIQEAIKMAEEWFMDMEG